MGCKQETKEETMERNVNLPEYLRQLRKSRHYKQEDIALQLQISRQTYSHYETGRIRPSIHVLYKLAKFYGVSADEILEHMEELPFKQEEMEEEQDRRGKSDIRTGILGLSASAESEKPCGDAVYHVGNHAG